MCSFFPLSHFTSTAQQIPEPTQRVTSQTEICWYIYFSRLGCNHVLCLGKKSDPFSMAISNLLGKMCVHVTRKSPWTFALNRSITVSTRLFFCLLVFCCYLFSEKKNYSTIWFFFFFFFLRIAVFAKGLCKSEGWKLQDSHLIKPDILMTYKRLKRTKLTNPPCDCMSLKSTDWHNDSRVYRDEDFCKIYLFWL